MSKISYQPIPDIEEDVTPAAEGSISSITKRARKSFSIIFLTLCAIAVILIAFVFGYKIKSEFFTEKVKIYQSSQSLDHSIKEISADDMQKMGFHIGSFAFGNAQCQLPDQKAGSCTPPNRKTSKIHIDSTKIYQTIIGFGGAFTEASAHNFFKLPTSIQEKFMDLYFGPNGINYNMGRIHINSCDFSINSYSFDDVPNDYDLLYFDTEVTHDQAQILPFIRKAMSNSRFPFKILASPWSPPAWMKQGINKSMTGSAVPNGLTDTDDMKTTWAKYISKFLQAYENQGVKVWAVTPQNEPEFPAPWEACAYTADYEKDFVTGFLGPTLKHDHPDALILAFDHNKDHLKMWSDTMLNGHGRKYVDGMAFHWYGYNDDRYLDGTFGYDNVNFTHHMAPDKILLASEGCSCPGVSFKSQLRAERLVHDVIFDINNYAQGWIDWNLLVDSKGGPNHLGNMCDAPIVTNEDFSDIIIQPKYSYFGQISKFVTPGSQRVASTVLGSYGFTKINPNVRPGFELGLYLCEQSVRQVWTFDHSTGYLMLTTKSLDEETSPPFEFDSLCVGPGTDNRPLLNLVFCSGAPTNGMYPKGSPLLKPLYMTMNKFGQLQVKKGSELQCVVLANGVTEPGALFALEPCASGTVKDSVPGRQRFFYESLTGELTSLIHSDVFDEHGDEAKLCVTAGWPFLYSAAFIKGDDSSSKETVVVIVNEANAPTHIILSDAVKNSAANPPAATKDKTSTDPTALYNKRVNLSVTNLPSPGDIWFGIDARSIQTLVY